MAAAEKMQTKRSEPEKRAPEATAPLIAPTVRSKLTMTTKRRPARFPTKRRTTPGPQFGRRQPLPLQKRNSNKLTIPGAMRRESRGCCAQVAEQAAFHDYSIAAPQARRTSRLLLAKKLWQSLVAPKSTRVRAG